MRDLAKMIELKEKKKLTPIRRLQLDFLTMLPHVCGTRPDVVFIYLDGSFEFQSQAVKVG